MTGWWLASYLVLWGLVLSALVVMLVVLRQLGLIYLRTRQGGLLLDEGPVIGAVITPFSEIQMDGQPVSFPSTSRALTFLLFTSPHCAICKDVARGVAAARRHRDAAFFVLSEGDAIENAELRELVGGSGGFVASLHRQRLLGIQTIPYGIVTDRKGVVRAKGIVNSLDDLESILDRAEELEEVVLPAEVMEPTHA